MRRHTVQITDPTRAFTDAELAAFPDGEEITATTHPHLAEYLGDLPSVWVWNYEDPRLLADLWLTAEELGGRTPTEAWEALHRHRPEPLALNDEWADDDGPGLGLSLRVFFTDTEEKSRALSFAAALAVLHRSATLIRAELATPVSVVEATDAAQLAHAAAHAAAAATDPAVVAVHAAAAAAHAAAAGTAAETARRGHERSGHVSAVHLGDATDAAHGAARAAQRAATALAARWEARAEQILATARHGITGAVS
jgi:hypothetical protein